MIDNYLIYITLALTVTAIPGPAVVLTIKNSLRHGYKSAAANIFGNFSAMVILATLSAFGLGAVILTSSTLFSTIKILGCLYLIYLGVKAWRAPAPNGNGNKSFHGKSHRPFGSVFKEGFAVGIANPKAIAFFTALFPQFIDPAREFIPQFLVLIFTIEGISFFVLMFYALLAALAAPYLFREKSMGIFNKLTGTSFIGFGIALIFEDRG